MGEQNKTDEAARLNGAVAGLQAAILFIDQVRKAAKDGEEVTATGAARDGREWLESAARALIDVLSTPDAAPKVEPAQQATKGAHPIFAFLDGSAPFEGVWFSEQHPTRKGKFWWRSVLREALAAQQAPAQPPAKVEREGLTEELFAAADEALELTRLHGGPQLPRLFEAVRAIQCNRSGG